MYVSAELRIGKEATIQVFCSGDALEEKSNQAVALPLHPYERCDRRPIVLK